MRILLGSGGLLTDHVLCNSEDVHRGAGLGPDLMVEGEQKVTAEPHANIQTAVSGSSTAWNQKPNAKPIELGDRGRGRGTGVPARDMQYTSGYTPGTPDLTPILPRRLYPLETNDGTWCKPTDGKRRWWQANCRETNQQKHQPKPEHCFTLFVAQQYTAVETPRKTRCCR